MRKTPNSINTDERETDRIKNYPNEENKIKEWRGPISKYAVKEKKNYEKEEEKEEEEEGKWKP